MEEWFKEIQNNSSNNVVSILVGNKKDLEGSRVISSEKAEQFAQSHKMQYIEVSSKNYQNVDEAFLIPCESVLKKVINK